MFAILHDWQWPGPWYWAQVPPRTLSPHVYQILRETETIQVSKVGEGGKSRRVITQNEESSDPDHK